jgi:hypothetical protein
VVLDLSAKTPTIEVSDNVEAVTEVDSRALVVHFARPFPDELYRCDVIPSEPVKFQIKGRSKEGVGVVFSSRYPKKIKIVCEEI